MPSAISPTILLKAASLLPKYRDAQAEIVKLTEELAASRRTTSQDMAKQRSLTEENEKLRAEIATMRGALASDRRARDNAPKAELGTVKKAVAKRGAATEARLEEQSHGRKELPAVRSERRIVTRSATKDSKTAVVTTSTRPVSKPASRSRVAATSRRIETTRQASGAHSGREEVSDSPVQDSFESQEYESVKTGATIPKGVSPGLQHLYWKGTFSFAEAMAAKEKKSPIVIPDDGTTQASEDEDEGQESAETVDKEIERALQPLHPYKRRKIT
ncbi:hypothetical protein CAC42_574 [Sphaceloma murrayae]|uniref:Uncharacterized protein n=1 Tax=Sphaceloma murrayae TaxID=2082308 RepID=A0A2K1R3V8_9PEZI|nr:hypothetical protein CAC42_574 [Sphaceloma murrayae]